MSLATSSFTGLKDYVSVSHRMQRAKEEVVRLVLLISPTAPLFVIDALKAAFVPETASVKLHIEALSAASGEKIASQADACIVASGQDVALDLAVAKRWQEAGVSCCMLSATEEDSELARALLPELDVSRPTSQREVRLLVAAFLARTLSQDKAFSSAFCFSFVRPAIVQVLAQKVALANAAIGAIDFLGGADFPAMFVSEATLLAQVGALYGDEIMAHKLLDFGAVFAWALFSRTVARRLEAVLPVPKPVVRAGSAFVATYALGNLIAFRYASQKLLQKKVKGVAELFSRGIAGAASLAGTLQVPKKAYEEEVTYQIEIE